MSREPAFQRDLSSPIEERRFEVGAPDHGRRLDVFLAEKMSWRSRARIQELIVDGRVTVARRDDEVAVGRRQAKLRPNTRLRGGDGINVRLDSAFVDAGALGDAATPEVVLEIVYEDDLLLAVDKPPRMSLYPTRRHLEGSLTELVHRRHRALGLAGSPPSPCHRLDRETSGLLLFAKDRETRAHIGRQFEERTVEKTYLAMVKGLPEENEGVIDLPLGRDLSSRVEIKQGPRPDGGGLAARTRWRVLERHWERDRALLELRPETGRQHQLRAHLAAIGHPILGDRLYLGGDEVFLGSLDRELTASELQGLGGADRLELQAAALAIDHPAAGRLRIEAPPPDWK
jgi:23S rRNA pseudouridine1911/1915/1917 synthase